MADHKNGVQNVLESRLESIYRYKPEGQAKRGGYHFKKHTVYTLYSFDRKIDYCASILTERFVPTARSLLETYSTCMSIN